MKTLIGLIASVMLATTAYAQDTKFVKGEVTRVTKTVLCDTLEQINEIGEAQTRSWPEALATYLKWARMKKPDGDIPCFAPRAGQFLFIKPLEVVGGFTNLHTPTGEMIEKMYVIAVLWPFSANDWRPGFIFSRYGVEAPQEEGEDS